jgi:hypothetical protein
MFTGIQWTESTFFKKLLGSGQGYRYLLTWVACWSVFVGSSSLILKTIYSHRPPAFVHRLASGLGRLHRNAVELLKLPFASRHFNFFRHLIQAFSDLVGQYGKTIGVKLKWGSWCVFNLHQCGFLNCVLFKAHLVLIEIVFLSAKLKS